MAAKKISEQDKIEASNLLESASEMMGECINCGLCKAASPLSRALQEEQLSARGQAQLLASNILDTLVFEHTLCKGEAVVCPKNIDIDEAIRKARQALVLRGRGLKANEKMVELVEKKHVSYEASLEET